MNRSAYYKNLFLIGGIWNIAAAFPVWLGGILMPEFSFGFFGINPPAVLFPYHAMFWFIIAFGIGYLIVSRDITKNHGVVVIGITAKTLFFIDCVITLALNQANVLLLLVGTVDMIFVSLFVEFLLSVRKGLVK
ncbi:MAG: hypothetical protein KA369_09295 [Spirochaetes bacterium]|nr:hypothetical protein [Spirochaetota bacterium]